MENTDSIENSGEVNRAFLTDDGKTVELGKDSNGKIKNGPKDEGVKKIENGRDSKENVGRIGNGLKSTERGIDVQMLANGDEGGMREDGKNTEEGRRNGGCVKAEEVRIEEGAETGMCGRRTPFWVTRVRRDLAMKQFIPIKVLFFLLFGAMMCLFPFLTLQARSLGITERELSLLFALNPVVAFVGPPLTGILADKIGNFKLLLSVLMATSGAVGLGYLVVPEARRLVPLPSQLPYTLNTTSPAQPDHSPAPTLTLASPHVCQYQPTLTNFTVVIANCTLCNSDGPESVVDVGDDGAVEVKVLREGEEHNITTTLLVTAWPRTLTTLSKATDVRQAADNTEKAGGAEGCVVMCYAGVASEGLCTNTNTTQELSPSATFFSYMAIRLIGGIALATSHTMFQGATMAILRQYKGDLGLQGLYGNMGAIVMTPISGVLIDVVSGITGRQDFRPAFFLYFGLKLVASMVIMVMDLDFRMPSDKVTKDFKVLLKNPEVITFLVVMLITGAFFGLLDTFLFWLLQDLGAKKSLMGITVTVGTSAGIPVLVASGYIIKKLGHANTIIMGLAFYAIRMIGYSFLTNPWWCMPFEMLECFTVSLLGTASTTYADELATPSTIATLQGMYGGIHHGVGRAFGSLVGGFLIGPLGIRLTFRIAAGVSAVTCVIYFVANRFFFRKQQEERRKSKELKLRESTEGKFNGTETKKNIDMDVKCDGENNKSEGNDVECDAVKTINQGKDAGCDVDVKGKDVDIEKECDGVANRKLQDKGMEGDLATTVENNDADDNLAHKEDIAKTPKEVSKASENSIIGSDKKMTVEENLDKNVNVRDGKLGSREYHNPAYEGD